MTLKENSYESSDREDGDYSSEDEETVEFNGFQVLASQENLVREMFKKFPDLTLNFDLKNQQLKNAYMDVLLDLNETLSTKELSLEDLDNAESTLLDLTRAGLKVGWLRQKLDEAYLKRVSRARIRELEEQVKQRKLTLFDLESDLMKEKAAALSSSKDRFGFNDVRSLNE